MIALLPCILGQNAPLAANAGVVVQEGEYSHLDMKRMILKDSPLKWPVKRDKVIALSKKLLNRHKSTLTRRQEREIAKELVPNIDEIRFLIVSNHNLRDRFRKALEDCLEPIFRGHPQIGHEVRDARIVANIVID